MEIKRKNVRPTRERFERRVDRTGGPNACHPWQGPLRRGYGQFWLGHDTGGRVVGSHVAAFILSGGTIGLGEVVDHICHNQSQCSLGDRCPHRRCCNPRHLRATTDSANRQAGRTLGLRWRKPTLACGHPRGSVGNCDRCAHARWYDKNHPIPTEGETP